MSKGKDSIVPFIAFFPIGLGLITIGISNGGNLFILSGVVFVIAGIVGIIRQKKENEGQDKTK